MGGLDSPRARAPPPVCELARPLLSRGTMMLMLDVDDTSGSLPLELDMPAAPTRSPEPVPTASVQAFRRCHRDGSELDRFGDCALCKAERARAEARKERNARIGLAAVVLVLLAIAGGWYGSSKLDERRAKAQAAQISEANGRKLVVYTLSSCPACRMARSHLDKRGIAYVERAVDEDPAAFAEFEKLNPQRSVPTFVIGDEVMIGFDPTGMKLAQALAKHGLPTGAVPSTQPAE